jgi:hypothetical protein
VFRRIELISTFSVVDNSRETFKSGLMGLSLTGVAEAWVDKLRGPDRSLPANARFYFTEKGWAEVGRSVIQACGQTGQDYRVIRIKEKEVNVVWRDMHTGYEVAAQPKKPRRT